MKKKVCIPFVIFTCWMYHDARFREYKIHSI